MESKNELKAIINPEIHNEIKLYIDEAHELTKENIGKGVSREMKNVHKAVKEHAENVNQNVTKHVMEYTAIIFSMAAFGVIAYVIVRSHMDRMRRNATTKNFRMTDQISEQSSSPPTSLDK